MIRHLPIAGALALTLAACTTPPGERAEVMRAASAESAGGACYGTDVSPAVIETVTEQAVLRPAERAVDGTLLSQAVYETETRQEIVREREALWFETPCDQDVTPDFIASLQRALAARGYYSGPAHGHVTPQTRAAVRAYQAERGLDSAIVSIETARDLGLTAFDTDIPPRPGG